MDPAYSEFLSLFRSHKVGYLIVGAYTVMKYSEPRYTKDLDLRFDSSPANARRVFAALAKFGAPLKNYTPDDFSRPGIVHQIGVPPLRVDILTSLRGLTFNQAWSRRTTSRAGGRRMYFVSLNDLIKSKRRAGRLQDTLDMENLKDIREGRRRKRQQLM